MRLIPVDERNALSSHKNITRVGVTVDSTGLTACRACPCGSTPRDALRRHPREIDASAGWASSRFTDDAQPGRCGQPRVNWCILRSVSATRRQSPSVSVGALQVLHHDQAIHDQPPVHRWDSQRHCYVLTQSTTRKSSYQRPMNEVP